MAYANAFVPIMRGTGVLSSDGFITLSANLVGIGKFKCIAFGNTDEYALMFGSGNLYCNGRSGLPTEIFLRGIGDFDATGSALINASLDEDLLCAGLMHIVGSVQLDSFVLLTGSGQLSVDIEFYNDPEELPSCFDLAINRIDVEYECSLDRCAQPKEPCPDILYNDYKTAYYSGYQNVQPEMSIQETTKNGIGVYNNGDIEVITSVEEYYENECSIEKGTSSESIKLNNNMQFVESLDFKTKLNDFYSRIPLEVSAYIAKHDIVEVTYDDDVFVYKLYPHRECNYYPRPV